MGATEASLGYGTVLKFQTGSPGVFATVEEMKDMPEFGEDSALVEVTHQESPQKRKEYIAGLKDGQDFTTQHNYISSPTQEAVRAAAGTTGKFQLVWSAAPTAVLTQEFDAVILGTKLSGPIEGAKMLSIHLKVSGEITETTLP